MLAARMLGKSEVGLGPLIENEFGIHLDKKYQKANWGVRPLSREMLRYAVSDTRFLSALKDRLSSQLKETAMLRLEYPDSSLAELGKLHEKPVGRSGVNHRLSKLSELAQRLREEKRL